MKKLLVIAISSMFLIAGCKKDETFEPEFVKGEVIAGIEEGVHVDEVFDLFNDLGLTIKSMGNFHYTASYPPDSISWLAAQLEARSYLNMDFSRVEDGGNNIVKVSVDFGNMSNKTDQSDWLNLESTLRLTQVSVVPGVKSAMVSVSEGTEKGWCLILVGLDQIEWAQTNGIIHLD